MVVAAWAERVAELKLESGRSMRQWGGVTWAQSSPRVARESWGLRSSHCRAEETSPRHGFMDSQNNQEPQAAQDTSHFTYTL